jgi:simple sugar transport system permease protein
MDKNPVPSTPQKTRFGWAKKIPLDSQTLLLLGVFIVLFIFFSVANDRFFTVRSVRSMSYQLPEIGVLSLAMMITILVGGINLSVNATSNMAAVIAGFFMVKLIPADASSQVVGLYMALAILVALLIGVLCGVLNGILVGYIGVPPILATLATFTLYTGISTGLTGGKTVTGFPDQFAKIGSTTVLGVPLPFIIFVLLALAISILIQRTTFGFKARMMGSNPVAATFSGIDNPSMIMKIFIISGVLSAVTGILTMSRTMSAAYEYGTTTFVLLTILISVLANILPGFGSVLNIFVAVLILQIISTGFNMLLTGVSGGTFFKDFSWGVLMILIFITNYFIRRRRQTES